jgi:hypothetical protein
MKMKFTGTRFTVFEKDVSEAMSVTDIIELADVKVETDMDRAATRRLLMRRFGKILDQMLDGDYGVNMITVERGPEVS